MSRARKPSDVSDKQRALRTDTAGRLEAIVEAAERAAESVIDDAEAQAHRYLAQARAEADRLVEGRASGLAELIDTLLGQASSLRQEAERLQVALEGAKTLVGPDEPIEMAGQQEPPQELAQPEVPRLRAVAPPEDSQQQEEETRRSDAAGARLLATQLAVSGSSREEIAQRLRNGFEIEDTDAILDAILGPEEQ